MKTAMSSSAAVSIVKRSSVMASNIILSGSHAVCTTSVGVDVVGSSSSTNYRFFASSSLQFNGIYQRSGLLRANARGSACHSLHKHELINLQPSSVHLQQQQQTRHFAQGGTHKRKKNRTPNNGSSSSRDGDHFDKYSFDDVDSKPKEAKKNVLVIGSSGVLGRTLVSHFGNSFQWNVLGADVVDPSEDNDDSGGVSTTKGLSDYIWLPKDGSMADLTEELFKGVQSKNRSKKLDAIVCASGGWMEDVLMGDVVARAKSNGDEGVDLALEYARESAEVVERMMRVNFYPIVAGSLVGSRFMNRGGTCYALDCFLVVPSYCNMLLNILFRLPVVSTSRTPTNLYILLLNNTLIHYQTSYSTTNNVRSLCRNRCISCTFTHTGNDRLRILQISNTSLSPIVRWRRQQHDFRRYSASDVGYCCQSCYGGRGRRRWIWKQQQ